MLTNRTGHRTDGKGNGYRVENLWYDGYLVSKKILKGMLTE
jgi:hypothetical protein